MKTFGFDEASNDFDKLLSNADQVQPEVKKVAIKMRDQARRIATSKNLNKTGAGVEGIEIEEKKDSVEVGWSQRPNFHLYFHELGFHALDNRRRKLRLKRSSKGKRARYYGGVSATYIAPKPHMRPAFDALEPEFYNKTQQILERGV